MKISHWIFDEGNRFAAIDRESLLTNACLSINVILKRIQDKLINSDIKKNTLHKLRQGSCKETTFSLNLFIFGQIGDVDMGSPLS